MKKILFSLLIIFSSFLMITVVHADENDKLLIIELPSNEISVLNTELTVRDMLIMSYISNGNVLGNNNSVISNQNGKEIIRKIGNGNNMIQYELLDNVTEEDCIIEITDAYREYAIQYFGEDVYGEYNKIQLKVTNIEAIELNGNVTVDLSIHNKIYDMKMSEYIALFMIANGGISENMREIVTLNSSTKEKLITFTMDLLAPADPSIDPEVTKITTVVSNEVTKDDDIIINLTTGYKNRMKNIYSINVDDYSKLILKISDFDYSDQNDAYVIDYTNLAKENAMNYLTVLDYFTNYSKLERTVIVLDANNRELISFFAGANNVDMFEMKVSDDLTYADNIYKPINDYYKQMFQSSFGITLNQVNIKFANPEFIEGKDKTFASNEKVIFRLNIDYNKFLQEGKLYIDNNLVDRKNYEISEGSTIITLNQDYANSLSNSNHVIRAVVNDGDVDTTFSVKSIINVPDTIKYSYIGFKILGILLTPALIVIAVYKLKEKH